MPLIPDLNNEANRTYWERARQISERVEKWPDWMKGVSAETKQNAAENDASSASQRRKSLK